jgi:hypothetical protein
LLNKMKRLEEVEPLMRRALAIEEQRLGPDDPAIATRLNNLSGLLCALGRFKEAEPLMRRTLDIFLKIKMTTGQDHPHLQTAIKIYSMFLEEMGCSPKEVVTKLNAVGRPYGIRLG